MIASLATASPLTGVSAQARPRVLLIYDMEGVSGVTRAADVSFASAGYASARESLTEDVNAAIRGLLKGGAREVVVTDGHGSGNIEPDYDLTRLPAQARFDLRDQAYDPFIEAVDSTFDAVVAVGMHGRAGGRGFYSHTYYAHTRWMIAGNEMNESMIVAASAARFGVPLILVTGDDVLAGEVAAFSPRTVYATVKKAVNRTSAEPTTRDEANKILEEAAERAMRERKTIPAWAGPSGPFENHFSYTLPDHAALAINYPGARAVNERTVLVASPDFISAYLAFRALAHFTVLAPMRRVLEALPVVQGGPEVMVRIREQAGGERPSFMSNGGTIDQRFSAMTRHGYR